MRLINVMLSEWSLKVRLYIAGGYDKNRFSDQAEKIIFELVNNR